MMRNNAVELNVSTDGNLEARTIIPAIKGYEGIQKIDYDYNSLANHTKIEVESSSDIRDLNGLVDSITKNVPEDSGIQLICTIISSIFQGAKKSCFDFDSRGRLLNACR